MSDTTINYASKLPLDITTCPDPSDWWTEADRDRLRQAFKNDKEFVDHGVTPAVVAQALQVEIELLVKGSAESAPAYAPSPTLDGDPVPLFINDELKGHFTRRAIIYSSFMKLKQELDEMEFEIRPPEAVLPINLDRGMRLENDTFSRLLRRMEAAMNLNIPHVPNMTLVPQEDLNELILMAVKMRLMLHRMYAIGALKKKKMYDDKSPLYELCLRPTLFGNGVEAIENSLNKSFKDLLDLEVAFFQEGILALEKAGVFDISRCSVHDDSPAAREATIAKVQNAKLPKELQLDHMANAKVNIDQDPETVAARTKLVGKLINNLCATESFSSLFTPTSTEFRRYNAAS